VIEPIVTVVVPTANRPVLLDRALNSVRRQIGISQEAIETIVVDDGAELSVKGIVEKYRGTYYRTPGGKGGAASRNIGIKAAQGEFVAFLDDDDEWHPRKLDRQLSVMQALNVEFSSTGLSTFDERTQTQSVRLQRSPQQDSIIKALLKENWIGTASSVIIRRSVLEKHGGFNERYPAAQDYELWTRLLLAGTTYSYIEDPLVVYHPGSHERISGNRRNVRRGLELYVEDNAEVIAQYGLKSFWEGFLFRLSAEEALVEGDNRAFRQLLWSSVKAYPRNLRRIVLLSAAFLLPIKRVRRLVVDKKRTAL
jgi:glycosyltransferase involved in cell wall biosynthesis